jgi:nicotinamidase-related amidase
MSESHFDISTKDWVRPNGICLVIIDMQKVLNDYSPIESEQEHLLDSYSAKDFHENLSAVVENLKALISFYRESQLPIIYTRIGHHYEDLRDMPRIHKTRFSRLTDANGDPYFMMPGYRQYEIIDELKPNKSDIVIDKTTSDSFHGTNLDIILRNNNVSRLVIVGSVTTCCVSSTTRSAFDLGYLPTVLSDASIATSQKFHEAELMILKTYYANVLTSNEFFDTINL